MNLSSLPSRKAFQLTPSKRWHDVTCVTDEYKFLRPGCPRSTLTTRICACIGEKLVTSLWYTLLGLLFKAVQIVALAGEWEPSEVMCFNITGITRLACNWSRLHPSNNLTVIKTIYHPCISTNILVHRNFIPGKIRRIFENVEPTWPENFCFEYWKIRIYRLFFIIIIIIISFISLYLI